MTEEEVSIEANLIATAVYELLRTKSISPDQATFVCMMVMYHIWNTTRTMTFEEWHTWIAVQLAQIHLDNTPTETRN